MEPQKEVNQDYSVKQQNKWQMPDTYVILFFVLLLGFLATYVLPSGLFERETIDGVERVFQIHITGQILLLWVFLIFSMLSRWGWLSLLISSS